MRCIKLLLLLSLSGVAAFAQSETWTNLFDGKNLNGWRQLNGNAKYPTGPGQAVFMMKPGGDGCTLQKPEVKYRSGLILLDRNKRNVEAIDQPPTVE